MREVLTLLGVYNVTQYEVVTWLTSALEHKMGDDDSTKRLENLLDDLNELSWNVQES